MQALIKPKTINFADLLKNSKTTVSLNVKSQMLDIFNEELIEKEQRWYIANLFMYMHYHPTNDYPINLVNIYKMLGFANKGNAKRTLVNNFINDEDYKITQPTKTKTNKENIMLNLETFKHLCMIAKTDMGKKIRKYYIKLESIYNQIIKIDLDEYQ